MGCEACKPQRAGCLSACGEGGVHSEAGSVAIASTAPAPPLFEGVRARTETLKFLAKVKLFKHLPEDQRPILADACKEVSFEAGQTIIQQGDDGNEFFVIRNGQASVYVSGKKVSSLKRGDYFGELSLVHDEPRAATIIAEKPLLAFSITRATFEGLGLKSKLRFPKRKAVGGGGALSPVERRAESEPKKPEERSRIMRAIQENENLKKAVKVDNASAQSMADFAFKKKVVAGTELIKQGDPGADYFYIVQDGCFEVILNSSDAYETMEPESMEHRVSVACPAIGPGGSFGELALLYMHPRAATVRAQIDSVVWCIHRSDFKVALSQMQRNLAREYVKYLDRVEILKSLQAKQKEAVAEALVEVTFSKDDMVVEQGEEGDTFYILYDGEVAIIKDGKEEAKLTGKENNVQYFGERALLAKAPRAATVKVVSPTAKALAMDKVSFDMLLGSFEWRRGESELQPPPAASQQAPREERRVGARSDLKVVGLLGCGGFGHVELVENVKTGDTFALKSMSKGFVVMAGMQKSVCNEKDMQLLCNSTFIVKLYETYNDPQFLLLLLELCLGGDLYGIYQRHMLHGSEPHAKFYVAGVVLAFEHMHKKKIVYRDLKPENLLLTETGQLKVTDMGLAKVIIGKTYTTCGTPDYFAPEVIGCKGYMHAIDWWTVGILLFELLAGRAPFASQVPMEIFEKVMKGIDRVKFPPACNIDSTRLIKELLKPEPSERLPMKKAGVKGLQKHRWFQGFDWDKMAVQQLPPPFVPAVRNRKDLTNFDAVPEDMPPQVPYTDDKSGWDAKFATSR